MSLPELENLNDAEKSKLKDALKKQLKKLEEEQAQKTLYGTKMNSTNQKSDFVVPYVFTPEVISICKKKLTALIKLASYVLNTVPMNEPNWLKNKIKIKKAFTERHRKLFAKLIRQLGLIEVVVINAPEWSEEIDQVANSNHQQNDFSKESDAYASLVYVLNFGDIPFHLCSTLPKNFEAYLNSDKKPYYGATVDEFSIHTSLPEGTTPPTVHALPEHAIVAFKTSTWHNSLNANAALSFI